MTDDPRAQRTEHAMKKKTTKTTGKRKPSTTRTTPVIVRTYAAGVHYGYPVSRSDDGTQITLAKSRRIFRWQLPPGCGASQNTCSELAVYGVARDSKVAVVVDEIAIVGVIEVIPCSTASATSIERWSS